jgi:hypothetical protein
MGNNNINITRDELMIGRETYSLSAINDRQFGVLSDQVYQLQYSIEKMQRTMAALQANYDSMTAAVGDGFRWAPDFVARDANDLADVVLKIRDLEQSVVQIARAVGVL